MAETSITRQKPNETQRCKKFFRRTDSLAERNAKRRLIVPRAIAFPVCESILARSIDGTLA